MIKDAAELFAAEGQRTREIIERRMDEAKDTLELRLEEALEYSKNQNRYRYVREEILPLLQRIEDEGERYAALDDVAKTLGLKVGNLKKAFVRLEGETREKSEEEQDEEKESLVPEPGTERYEQAMEVLKHPDILEKATQDMERLGHVGERRTKKLALVCSVSARARRPIQPSTHAQSSAGKNYLWDTVTSLLPPESVIKRSGLTAKALFRTQADLQGAVLYIQEVVGSEDADFSIRVLQSDGALVYESTEKMPDGSMGTVVYRKEGPCVVVQTTTSNHLHPENETRVFPIYIDESVEQTHRIVESILESATGSGVGAEEREEILEPWRDAIRLLEVVEVVVPYAKRIVLPSTQIRIRRDAGRLLDVIRIIAFLHQFQRDRDTLGRVVASEEDFHTALELVRDSLTRAWRVLTPAEEKVLEAIKTVPTEKRTNGFTKRDLKVKGMSNRRLNEILKSLTDTGRLDCDRMSGPQGYTYTLAQDAEEIDLGISLRPPPDEGESPSNENNFTEREDNARDHQTPNSSEENRADQEAGGNGQDSDRQVENDDLQEKDATERSGMEDIWAEENGDQWGEETSEEDLFDSDRPTPDDSERSKTMDRWELDETSRKRVTEVEAVLRQHSTETPEVTRADADDLIQEGIFEDLDFWPTVEEVGHAQMLIEPNF